MWKMQSKTRQEGKSMSPFVKRERERRKKKKKKKDEPDIISMIYKLHIAPFISLVLRINCLNKFYYSKKQHK